MNLYDEEIGIPFSKIKEFFKKEDFYNSLQKAEMSQDFEIQYKKCYETYKKCIEDNLLDEKLNEGHSKIIYTKKNDDDHIIKIFKTKDHYNNEKNHYEKLINYGLEKLVPKMEFKDHYSIVEKVEPIDYIGWVGVLNRYLVFPENHGAVYLKIKSLKENSNLGILEKVYNEDLIETIPDFAICQDRLVVLHIDKFNWNKVEENLEELLSEDFLLE